MKKHLLLLLSLTLLLAIALTACGASLDGSSQTAFPEELCGDWYLPPQVREDVNKDKFGIGISEFKINRDGVLLINDTRYRLTEVDPGLYASDDSYYIIDLRTGGIMSYKDRAGVQHDFQGVTLYVDGDSTIFLSEEDLREIKRFISEGS